MSSFGRKCMAVAATAMLLASAGAWGQEILAIWNSEGVSTSPSGSYVPNSVCEGVICSNLAVGSSVGSALTPVASGNGVAGNAFVASGYTATSYNDAMSKKHYWEFCIAGSNACMTLDTLTYAFGGPKTGPQALSWAWSTDRTNWTLLSTLDMSRTATKYFEGQAVDLSTLPADIERIWFRLYAWGASQASGAGSFGQKTDVLILTGSLAPMDQPPRITFDPAVLEAAVSNKCVFDALLSPQKGAGISVSTLTPTPNGTNSFTNANSRLLFTPKPNDEGSNYVWTVTATNSYGSTTATATVQVIAARVLGNVTLTFDRQAVNAVNKTDVITEPRDGTLQWDVSNASVQRDERDQCYGGAGRALRFNGSGLATLTSKTPVLYNTATNQGISKVTWYVGIMGGLEEEEIGPTVELRVSPDLQSGHWVTVDAFEADDYAADGSLTKRVTVLPMNGPAYLQFRVRGNGKNVNLDQVTIEPMPKPNNVDAHLLNYNVTPGDDRTASTEDYDGDGLDNRNEWLKKKNPYYKDNP